MYRESFLPPQPTGQRLAAQAHRRRSFALPVLLRGNHDYGRRPTGFVELTSLGFFMNKAHSYLISCDFRSAGLAQVCLAPAKNHSEAAGQCPNQGKTIGADPIRHPLPILSSAQCVPSRTAPC